MLILIILFAYICIMFGIVLFLIKRYQNKCRKYIEDLNDTLKQKNF